MIIENDFVNSLRFKKQRMKFRDAEKCYYSFLEQYPGKSNPTYWELSAKKDYESAGDFSSELLNSYIPYKDKIIRSVSLLDGLICLFRTAVKKQDAQHIDVDATFKILQDIMFRKNMQIYQFKKILKLEEPETAILDTIYNNFGIARSLWGRYAFTGLFDAKIYSKTLARLEDIPHLEAQWNDYLFSLKAGDGNG